MPENEDTGTTGTTEAPPIALGDEATTSAMAAVPIVGPWEGPWTTCPFPTC